ncbi:MAG TPA: haloacid dehalogenase [Desulfobacteraceae bacterium]|nr:haloacid dehalogenase [Desulfobacteraceae bacterium]
MIDPGSLAFDIDGVVADTMTLFVDIARDEFNLSGIRYEDFTCYQIEECTDIDNGIINTILSKIQDGNYKSTLKPVEGAPRVLTRLGRLYSPVVFVTARPYLGPIYDWLLEHLPVEASSIEIITTGSFEGKKDVLLRKNISYFIEDRLETCFLLKEAGITPVLFRQPWNRKKHPFTEISRWSELEEMIGF